MYLLFPSELMPRPGCAIWYLLWKMHTLLDSVLSAVHVKLLASASPGKLTEQWSLVPCFHTTLLMPSAFSSLPGCVQGTVSQELGVVIFFTLRL